jgi:hypothetical protein
MKSFAFAGAAWWLFMGSFFPHVARADAAARLGLEKLKATHDAVEALQGERRPVELKTSYNDYRAILHSHSHWSHDSNSPIEEILTAAQAVGVKVIMFTEHPADHYDYFTDGHQGLREGVLLIPGAETQGFHAYPTRSIQQEKFEGPQGFADLVRRDDGLVFLCHLEERMEWQIAGITGTEIYNTHADLMDEKKLLTSFRSPLAMLAMLPALQKYPREFFAALQDYPADYLRKFDELCRSAPHTGVAGNDSHHNTGVRAILQEDGKVLVEDLTGKRVAELDPEKVSLLRPMVKDRQPGDVVLNLDLDPYERSYGYVSTHLLMNEQTQPAVWEALQAGRAYVAFDWMGDPTGFAFVAEKGAQQYPMGSEPRLVEGLVLKAEAPLPGLFKLVKDGQVMKEERARRLEIPIDEPGIYRVEVWQNLAGDLRPWILSNPIYVRAASDDSA